MIWMIIWDLDITTVICLVRSLLLHDLLLGQTAGYLSTQIASDNRLWRVWISVAEVQSRTDAENLNRRNRTESSVQSSSGSPVLAAVRFSVLRFLQNSWTVWEQVKIYDWNAKKSM